MHKTAILTSALLTFVILGSFVAASAVLEFITPDSSTPTTTPSGSMSSSSSSSGGGGGSGGGSSNSLPSERAVVFDTLSQATFEYESFDKFSVFKIEATFSEEAHNPALTIQQAFVSSTAVQPNGPGEILFNSVTFFRENIRDVTHSRVWFKIEKAAVIENRVDLQTITMKHRTGNGWEVVPTTREADEQRYYVFSASFNGIGTLAFVGQEREDNIVQTLTTPNPVEQPNNIIADFFQPPEGLENEPILSPKRAIFAFKFLLAGILLLVTLVVLLEVSLKVRNSIRARNQKRQLDMEIDQELQS